MADEQRFPFEECVTEPLLMEAAFKKCSPPQQMILKSIYGLELTLDEQYLWSAFNGFGQFDSLGYLTGVNGECEYRAGQEAHDITLIVGRRSGKSSKVSSFVLVYEALFGGHKAYVGSAKQDPIFLQVAQDLSTAKGNVRQFILELLEQSPIGKKELQFFKSNAVTADEIRLKRSLIMVGPPSIKLRGQAIAVAALDELAVWPKDRESANPDFEVEAAVKPAMMQFPHYKIIKTSTPWTEEGLLWKASTIGTYGRHLESAALQAAHTHTIVLCAPTAAMQNPHASREFLRKEQLKDPDTFKREYLAQFSKSKSGFLAQALLRSSVDVGIQQRKPEPGNLYIATLDPAFRRDAFAFCIAHLRNGMFMQDWIQSWRGTPESPLRPGLVLAEIAVTCAEYGVRIVSSDQYHSESLQELALAKGLVIESNSLTNELKHKMWGDFNSYLQQGKLKLLDHPDLLDELMKMEKKLTQFGNVQYYGVRDDLAMVTALAVHKALQYGEQKPQAPQVQKPLSTQVREKIQRKAAVGIDHQHATAQWWN